MVDDLQKKIEKAVEMLGNATVIVDERLLKDVLRLIGVKVPRGIYFEDKNENVFNLKFPVVVKVSSEDILHKSDLKAVKVGIKDMDELYEVIDEFRHRFKGKRILVEEMVQGEVEMIVGLKYYENYGVVVMIGVGGFLAELYKDVVFRSAPLTTSHVQLAIEDLKGRDILYGYRGITVNKDDLLKSVSIISYLGDALGDKLSSMDVNPLIVNREGAWAVDAKMILR